MGTLVSASTSNLDIDSTWRIRASGPKLSHCSLRLVVDRVRSGRR